MQIALKVVAVVIVAWAMLNEIFKGRERFWSAPLFNIPLSRMIQRILAAPVYGFACMLLAAPWNSAWPYPVVAQWVVLIGGSVLYFIGDFFLFPKD